MNPTAEVSGVCHTIFQSLCSLASSLLRRQAFNPAGMNWPLIIFICMSQIQRLPHAFVFCCTCVSCFSDFQTKEIPVISAVLPLQLLSKADRWLLKSIDLLKLCSSEEESWLSRLSNSRLRSAWRAGEVTSRCHRSRRAANDCHRGSCDPA